MWKRLFGCGRAGRSEAKLDQILERLRTMSKQMDDLKAAVAREGTVIDSAIALIKGLAAQIAAGADDPVAMTALSDEANAKSDALAAAVLANTTPPTTP